MTKSQWSLTKALFLRPFRPATSAANTQNLSLRRAFLIHVLATLCGIVALVTFLATFGSAEDLHWRFRRELSRSFLKIVESLEQRPAETLLEVALFEGLWLLVALIITAWGARDEPIRASFAHSLRHTWLHTIHIVLVTLACALVIDTHDTVIRPLRDVRPSIRPEPIAPDVPFEQQAASPEWQEYEREIGVWWSEYSAERIRILLAQPWWIRHSEWLVFDVCVAFSLWALWALLRAVGAERRVPPIPRPPMCDACGYNLTGLPDNSRCPECGLPTLESLDPHVRRGAAWECNKRAKLRISWLTMAVAAIRRPTELGRSLSLTEHAAHHRWFYFRSIFWIFFGAVTALGLPVLIASNWRLHFQVFLFPILATFYTAAAFAVPMLLTTLTAIKIGASCKRNLLPAAAQIFCYLSPWIVMGTVFAGTTGLIAIEIERTNLIRELTGRRNEEPVLFSAWLLLNATWLIVYPFIAARALRATRYANR